MASIKIILTIGTILGFYLEMLYHSGLKNHLGQKTFHYWFYKKLQYKYCGFLFKHLMQSSETKDNNVEFLVRGRK